MFDGFVPFTCVDDTEHGDGGGDGGGAEDLLAGFLKTGDHILNLAVDAFEGFADGKGAGGAGFVGETEEVVGGAAEGFPPFPSEQGPVLMLPPQAP